MSEERLVFVGYRPHAGKGAELEALVRKHVTVLRAEGLVTERTPLIGRAADGTIVEAFGWRSQAAIDAAHENPAVQALWAEFGRCCDYVPLATLPETAGPFAHFEPLDDVDS